MKKSLVCILLVFSVLFGLSSCVASDKKKLAEMAKTSVPATEEEAATKAGETKKSEGPEAIEEYSFTPEEESLLNQLGINPENLTEQASTEPVTLALGSDLMPDNGKDIKVELDSSGNPAGSSAKQDLKKIIQSKNFTLEAVYMVDGVTSPVKIAIKGNKYFMETVSPLEEGGASIRAQMLIDGQSAYAIIPSLKLYMKFDDVGDTDMIDPEELMDTDSKYISTSEVVLNGKTYICEHYKSEGTETKYYYLDGKIKRVEVISDDGTTTIVDITKLTDSADDKLFTLPKGFIPLDLNDLAGSAATTALPQKAE